VATLGLPALRPLTPRLTAGVIADARRHRRRRLVVAAAAATLGAGGMVALVVASSAQRRPAVATAHGSALTVAPATVLSRQPWIGSSCPGPHSVAAIERSAEVPLCGRVGLAIDLRTRAVTATATINGQSFKLDNAAWSDPPFGGKHTSLAGFLQHARFLHGPFKTVTFRNGIRQRFTVEDVHLVIDYGAGHKVQTSIQELGYGGWG
jgi:hypothetical protein